MSERIGVAGIGALGTQIVRQAHESNTSVLCMVRPGSEKRVIGELAQWNVQASEDPDANVTVQGVNFFDVEGMTNLLVSQGIPTFINTIANFDEGGRYVEEEAVRINATLPQKLAQAARKAEIKHMVHTSSIAVWGNISGNLLEGTPPNPRSLYGRTKHIGDQNVIEVLQRSDTAVTIVHPGNIFGAGADVWTNTIFEKSRNKEPFMLGKGANRMPVVDIDDVARAILLAAESPEASGKRFILVAGEKVTLSEIMRAYQECLTDIAPFYTPAFLGIAAAKAYDLKAWITGRKIPLTEEYARIATNNTWNVYGTLIKRTLPFSYTPVRETMRKSLKWLNKKNSLGREAHIEEFFNSNPQLFLAEQNR